MIARYQMRLSHACYHLPPTLVHTRPRSNSQQEEIRRRAAAETEVLRLELLRRCVQGVEV